MNLENIKIDISKEKGMFVAVVLWSDGQEMATQARNYPELHANIYDLFKLRMDNTLSKKVVTK